MEKYTMFMDWKNQYSENEYITQSNLEIQCNPYQATNSIFHRVFLFLEVSHKSMVVCRKTAATLYPIPPLSPLLVPSLNVRGFLHT